MIDLCTEQLSLLSSPTLPQIHISNQAKTSFIKILYHKGLESHESDESVAGAGKRWGGGGESNGSIPWREQYFITDII